MAILEDKMPIVTVDMDATAPNPESRLVGLFRSSRKFCLVIAALYLAGFIWLVVHPIVSVVTGEPKCRGYFIDENSLDASHFRYEAKFSPAKRGFNNGIGSLCAAVGKHAGVLLDHVDCHSHPDSFDVAKLAPSGTAITPVAESIVLVVPPSQDWFASDFHYGMIQLLSILGNPKQTPWLAKTIMLVSSRSMSQTTDTTVSQFLGAFLDGGEMTNHTIAALPPDYTCAMIRNMLVLNFGTLESNINEVLILPQGRRGMLPNLDLVFLMSTIIGRSSYMDPRRHESLFLTHAYPKKALAWRQTVSSYTKLSPFLQSWLIELGDLVFFVRTLAVGPYPSHATSLERGIDAITIQASLAGRGRLKTTMTMEFLQQLVNMIRALSNLHERLHHSFSQYLMPSPWKFVSHSEYLIPNLLLLLPLVLRAVSILFFEITHLTKSDLGTSLSVLVRAAFISVVFYFVVVRFENDETYRTTAQLFLYGFLVSRVPDLRCSQQSRQLLHFWSCLVAIYLIAPLVMGHVALAYPTSLIWSPMLTTLKTTTTNNNANQWDAVGLLPRILLLVALWPNVLLIPYGVFARTSHYLTLVYMPLHLLCSLLVCSTVLSSDRPKKIKQS